MNTRAVVLHRVCHMDNYRVSKQKSNLDSGKY
jgi:hypothetical protein